MSRLLSQNMSRLWRWLKRHQGHDSHDAQFTSVVVHFILTAEVSGHLNIVRGARRLLNTELAVSAAWPSEDKIRVTKRMRSHARALRRARAMNEAYLRVREDRRWVTGIRFFARYPKLGILHLRSLWAPRILADLKILITKRTLLSLVLFVMKHPIAGVRHVVPNVKFRFDPRSRDKRQDLSITDPDLTDFDQDDFEESDEDGDPAETLIEAERMILDQQIVSAVERKTDSRLFGGRNHDEDRFVRLQLRNSYHYFKVPGSDDTQYVVFEPRLLMHESGVVQISLRLSTEGSLSTNQVVSLMWGPEPRLVSSKMSTPLLAGSGWEPLVSSFDDELDVGKPLACIAHKYPASMTDVLHAHLNAVMNVLRLHRGDWHNYSIAIAKPGDCCPQSLWRGVHDTDVHRLAIRATGQNSIADHVEAPTDLSMWSDHSLFATLGSAAYIQWQGDPPEGIAELNTVLVLEYALLIYTRLQSMESKVARMTLNERLLRKRYRDAIELFSELRQGNVRAGEARDIINHLLKEQGADQIRPTIASALELAGVAHSTVSASRASRRAWWITLLATIVSALVAVPPLQQMLAEIETVRSNGWSDLLIGPLRWAASLGFWGPWVLIGLLIFGIIVLMILGGTVRHRPRHIPSFSRGFAWPTKFKFLPPSAEPEDSDADLRADQSEGDSDGCDE